MLILGIDPGLNITGYGLIYSNKDGFILKEAGFIKTHTCEGLPKRLNKIYSSLSGLLDRCKPQALVLEKLYAHYRHPLTASLLGHARGVICLLAEQRYIPFYEYSATRVKKVTTGSGHASKLQIQKMVEHTMGLKTGHFGPMDTTDAISLAITHAYISRVNPVKNIKPSIACEFKEYTKRQGKHRTRQLTGGNAILMSKQAFPVSNGVKV